MCSEWIWLTLKRFLEKWACCSFDNEVNSNSHNLAIHLLLPRNIYIDTLKKINIISAGSGRNRQMAPDRVPAWLWGMGWGPDRWLLPNVPDHDDIYVFFLLLRWTAHVSNCILFDRLEGKGAGWMFTNVIDCNLLFVKLVIGNVRIG